MSNTSNDQLKVFALSNFILLAIYIIVTVVLSQSIVLEALIFYTPFLLITAILAFGLRKNLAQTVGYSILFVLILGLIGFSICVGSISIH
jgi:hypothetical protein